jgi:cysteine desulfurase/selenocysteine lyase
MTSLVQPRLARVDALDIERVRGEFPILDQQVHGHPLAYLDNAASAQRPLSVLAAVEHLYRHDYSNVHRGVHTLSQRSSEAYEHARARAARFLGAESADEIVFVRGTTEALNLVAQSYGRAHVAAGDEVVVTEMEHHSNIVPWQLLCEEKGARLRVAPVDDRGDLILEELQRLLCERTRVVAVTHVSNSLGSVNPIAEIAKLVHQVDAVLVVDGAQSVPHLPVDLKALGCDFFAFSGHKVYGPSGIGVLYGRRDLLDAMPPWQGGGGMIRSVSFERTLYADSPQRFEAGTPNIAGAIGLAAAFDFVEAIGYPVLTAHEEDLLERTIAGLEPIPKVRILGNPRRRVGVVSFLVDGIHAHDVGTFLDSEGIAVRVGHHCNQPLMERFGIATTTRASFAVYNTRDEVDRLVAGVHGLLAFFS